MWGEPTSDLTITVSPINTPSSQTASRNNTNPDTKVDLAWSKDGQNHNVMVVRKLSTGSWQEPSQGTTYSVGATLGDGKVVYNSSSTGFTDDVPTSGLTYDYKFYSENYSYYSDGVTATVTTGSAASDYYRTLGSGNWSASGTWQSSVNNSNWITATLAPTSSANTISILSSHTVTVDGTATAGALTINNGGALTINAGKALSVTGTLTNNAGASALVIKSDASATGSLLHGTASVPATFERYIANDQKWHFLSSPVASQAIWPQFAPTPTGTPLNFGASPWYWDFYYWNPNASWTGTPWVNLRLDNGDYNSATIDLAGNSAGFGSTTPPAFTTGRGYLSAYTTGWTTGSPTIHTFSGNLHQGAVNISISASANKFNLAGNPYPSSIDWKAASGWTRNDLSLNGSGYDYWIFNDNTGNYGVFNSAGTSGTNGVGQYIAPGQAFFVYAGATGTLGMNDNVRAHSAQSWLKQTAGDAGSLSLTLTTTANAYSDEMVVAFDPSFTEGGSLKLAGFYVEAPEIWSVSGDQDFSIARYPKPSASLAVPVHIKTGVTSEYTITANDIASFSLCGKVLLDDLKTGLTQNLKADPVYTFSAAAGDDPARFLLRFDEMTGTGAPGPAGSLKVFAYGRTLLFRNIAERDAVIQVRVLNMLGQEVSGCRGAVTSLTVRPDVPPGWYVVNVVTNLENASKTVFIH